MNNYLFYFIYIKSNIYFIYLIYTLFLIMNINIMFQINLNVLLIDFIILAEIYYDKIKINVLLIDLNVLLIDFNMYLKYGV